MYFLHLMIMVMELNVIVFQLPMEHVRILIITIGIVTAAVLQALLLRVEMRQINFVVLHLMQI